MSKEYYEQQQAVQPVIAHNPVVLDFTDCTLPSQECAIMPTWLAKKLMMQLTLQETSAQNIIGKFLDDVRATMYAENAVEASVACALQYVQMRQLVSNISKENWDAYAVK